MSAFADLDPLRARVIEVNPERGEARLVPIAPGKTVPGERGQIQSRRGPVGFRVLSSPRENEILVREERSGEMESVRAGDAAILFPSPDRIAQEARESLRRLDELLPEEDEAPPEVFDVAPDFLAEVTGEILDDYEAWLLQLEAQPIAVSREEPVAAEAKEPIPFYPDLEVRQELTTGVDYDRFVFHATREEGAPRQVDERVGRFVRWNYTESGDLWKNRSVRFENEMEANEFFLIEELEVRDRKDFANGDHLWWENRSIWKVFLNDQGDSYFLDDFEARYVKKLSEKWEHETGITAQWKREYNTDSDDGYLRGTFLTKWGYRDGFERWFDLSYEFTREVRNESRNRPQDYWEHRFEAQYFLFEEDWSLDLLGETYYRDYNQPGSEQDEFQTRLEGTVRRNLSEQWSLGSRVTLEPRFYPTTGDTNSNAVRAQFAPIVEYTSGSSLFVTAEPRIGQVFHFGTVPDDVFLPRTLPRDKSDGDYREAGMSLSVSWFPSERWRFSLFEDVYHRWFPYGETGATAFYLFDFPRLADSTNIYSSLSVDYLVTEDLEISLRLSHTKQIFDEYDDNDTESFNGAIEAQYNF